MPLKTIPVLRRRGALRINRRNKLTRGLVWCVAPGVSMRELVGKKVGRTVFAEHGVHRSRNAFGAAARSINNHTVGGLMFPANSQLKTVSLGFTISFVGAFVEALQGFTGLLSFPFRADGNPDNDPAHCLTLRRTVATTAVDLFVATGPNPGDAYDDGCAAGFLEIGENPHVYAVSRSNNGVMQSFWKDGALFVEAFASSTAPVHWGGNTNGVFLNSAHGNLNNFGNSARGTANIGAVWNRALTPAEHASFAADPGQIFLDETADDDELLILGVPGLTTVTADRAFAVGFKGGVARTALLNIENVGTAAASGNRLIFDDPLIGSGFT